MSPLFYFYLVLNMLNQSVISRSPDPENAKTGMGGWGLGIGNDDKKVNDDPEDDNDSLDWETAQVCRFIYLDVEWYD